MKSFEVWIDTGEAWDTETVAEPTLTVTIDPRPFTLATAEVMAAAIEATRTLIGEGYRASKYRAGKYLTLIVRPQGSADFFEVTLIAEPVIDSCRSTTLAALQEATAKPSKPPSRCICRVGTPGVRCANTGKWVSAACPVHGR